MSNRVEVLKLLEQIGIRGYEARAYLALLELGEASATTIALKAGVPQPRIYEVLDTLLRKGLIEVKMGRPKRYTALSPNIALNAYVRRYVDNIYANTNRLINTLIDMHKAHEKLKEPLIWINYNIDTGSEKAKNIIESMSYDGFISSNLALLTRLQYSIIEKLKHSKENTSALAITVIHEHNEEKARRIFEDVDRVEVRFLPTGIVKMVEVDLSDVLIFGDNYVIHSKEKEIVLITYEIYYFGYWRIGKVIKPFNIKSGMKFTLKHHWLALDIASMALSMNYNVIADIEGIHLKDNRKVRISGYVKSVKRSPGDTIRAIIVESKEGSISIGGLGASIEDVKAERIALTVE